MTRVGQQDGKTINFSIVFGPQHRPFKCVYWTDRKASCRLYKNKPNAYNMYTVWKKFCLFVYAFTSASLLGGIFCQIFCPISQAHFVCLYAVIFFTSLLHFYLGMKRKYVLLYFCKQFRGNLFSLFAKIAYIKKR